MALWLTRRSNLDSQRSVSPDMRAHILQLIQTQKEQFNNQNFLTIYKPFKLVVGSFFLFILEA